MAEGFITRRGGKGGVDVSDATAVQSDVLQGKTFYAGTEDKKTGTIPSKGAETFTPTTTNQTIAANQFLSGTQTILGDTDLIPENIREGTTIFNVTGTLTPPPPPQFYLSFDGVDDFVEVPHNSSLDITQNITLECWVKGENFSDNSGRGLIARNTSSSSIGGPFRITHTRSGLNRGFQFGITNINGSFVQTTGNTTASSNEWIHVAGVYNGSTLTLYENGVVKGTANLSGNIQTTSENLYIGSFSFGGNQSSFLNGLLDEVRIWNVARTQQEIIDNKDKELTGNEIGLVSYWKFNEGSGTTAIDSAGSNDGTITGATYTEGSPF